MTRAVFDSNLVIGGVIWPGQSHLCLVAMARRRVRVFTSAWIIEEVRRSGRDPGVPNTEAILLAMTFERIRNSHEKTQRRNRDQFDPRT